MPTAMRALFISLNICGMPWFSFASPPTGQPMQLPFVAEVEHARRRAVDAHLVLDVRRRVTSLGSPSVPSAFDADACGTMKSVRPLVPAGAPSTRASTRWMMFSARSWSPPEMKIFVPRMV